MTLNEFRAEFDRTMVRMREGLENFPWENKEAYGNWCAQTYYYVLHSTHLLALSAAFIPVEQMKLHYRFVSHLKEESGHETMAKMDVKNLGFDLGRFPELTETRAFYQTQYHLVQNVHPLALFGYIFMLEGTAATIGMNLRERAEAAHGEKCINFWRAHSEDDPAHIKQAFAAVENLDGRAFDVIAMNMKDSASRYLGICAEIMKATALPGARKAG